jgi:tRNA(fMet)-specific endonuclease VapC
MTHILDTDVFSFVERRDSPEFTRFRVRAAALEPDDRIATTIVTYEEQTRGWLAFAARSRAAAHQVAAYAKLKKHLLTYLDFEVLDFDAAAARHFDHLRSLKLRLSSSDLKIAAIALSLRATLVTRNVRHFELVPDLLVEDWTKP